MIAVLVCLGYPVVALLSLAACQLVTRALDRRKAQRAPQGPCPCGAFGCHGKIEIRNGGNDHG